MYHFSTSVKIFVYRFPALEFPTGRDFLVNTSFEQSDFTVGESLVKDYEPQIVRNITDESRR